MKLPLHINLKYPHYDTHAVVVDASGRTMFTVKYENMKFARAVVRKFNRDWRYALFGRQPYEYTRQDWLEDRGIRIEKC